MYSNLSTIKCGIGNCYYRKKHGLYFSWLFLQQETHFLSQAKEERERKQAEKEEKKIKSESKKLIQGQATETRKRKMSTIEVNDSDDTQPRESKSQRREQCEVCGQIPDELNI